MGTRRCGSGWTRIKLVLALGYWVLGNIKAWLGGVAEVLSFRCVACSCGFGLWFGVVMRSVVGPSYNVAGVGSDVLVRSAHGPYDVLGPMAVSHEDHEYDVTAWGRGGLPQVTLWWVMLWRCWCLQAVG